MGAKSLVLPMPQKDGRQLFQYIIRGFPLRHNIKNSESISLIKIRMLKGGSWTTDTILINDPKSF